MASLLQNVSMKHLLLISLGFVVLGVIWMAAVWMSSVDIIWLVPGVFLIVSGFTKMISVQVWMRVAKLSTDEHRPIKAL